MAVVAVALLVGAAALTLVLRASLVDGLADGASTRAEQIAAQVEAGEEPSALRAPGEVEEGDDGEPDGELAQLTTSAAPGSPVDSSQPGYALPREAVGADGDDVALPGGEHTYVVASESVTSPQGQEYVVTVAVSREDVDEATEAVLPALVIGTPLLLLVVGATTWLVVGRALAPVERIRAEVDAITDDRLDRRVPEPAARDEIGRLATTMNAMLARLQDARARQQRFVSDASHELRSPLATLRQSAEVVRSHPDAFPPGELAETVRGEALRMQRLVEQMLVLARADERRTGERVEIDLEDLLYDEAVRVRRTGLVVDTSAVTPVREVADRAALSQIVRNLVDNAARHASARVDLALGVRDGLITLTVRDDGPGVPQTERERIFDRFVRLDEARARDAGGSGLGLAIVRDLTHALGGDVAVRDAEPGAEFVVRIPSRGAG